MKNTKLTVGDIATIVKMHRVSINRLFNEPKEGGNFPHTTFDDSFPDPIKIGRSVFFDSVLFYKWLSGKAGEKITSSDDLMTIKDIQEHYQKSTTWIWEREKANDIPRHFKINRSRFWIQRKITGKASEVTK